MDSGSTLLGGEKMLFDVNKAFLCDSASGELMTQFSLLTEDSQDLVRELVRALLEAPSARRRAGAKRVKRRLRARENNSASGKPLRLWRIMEMQLNNFADIGQGN